MEGNQKLKLKRPLVFFDLETTGTNIMKDRIVEISYLKVYPDGSQQQACRRVNPGIPIPAESTAVHHITDDDVREAPLFKEIASDLMSIFDNSDIAGYNSNKFDVPLLMEEFVRCGLNFEIAGRHFIDVQNIFHKKEQRTLVAAYKFYCNEVLEGAHSALADTLATYKVLLGQLERYPDLATDVEGLSKFSCEDKNVDLAGRIVYNEKRVPIFNFGKNKGREVRDVIKNDPSFIAWMMQNDFPKNTKDVLLQLKYKYENE